jgi:1-aminocyclopropane-1-carboxylate deaminase
MGCGEIMSELKHVYDRIFVACGTGTTLAGLALNNKTNSNLYGVSALKGGDFLLDTVKTYVHRVFNDAETESDILEKVNIITDCHFGGYAKIKTELVDFMRNFTAQTGVKLDPVYTAKAAFAMVKLAQKKDNDSKEKWLFIHSGGLQGIPAMEEKIKERIYPNC